MAPINAIEEDASKLLGYLQQVGLTDPPANVAGWQHMGAIIIDAALQASRRYSMVKQRASAFRQDFPTEGATVSGFLAIAKREDLASILKYHDRPTSQSPRVPRMINIATALESVGIDTVDDLRSALSDRTEQRQRTRDALWEVHGVGRKTVDYFDLLAGLADAVAIDSRVRNVLAKAGVSVHSANHASAVLRQAAASRGWTPAQIDKLLWSQPQ